ncbi:MAG: helix-turn-helix transcriptional regulator, partial [Planctomycetota bacterium]
MVNALLFIYQNPGKIMQVSDLTAFLNYSRRWLDKKFMRYLGHTVFAEIKRVRIDKIIRLM